MKNFFRSLSDLDIEALILRYPLFALSSISICVYLLMWITLDWRDTEECVKVASVLLPGIIIGLTEGIWRNKIIDSKLRYVPMAIAFLCLLGFMYNARFGYLEGWQVFRYVIFFFIAHLVFSASLWLASGKNMTFWSINIQFLLRFLGGVILALLLAGSAIMITHLIYFLFLGKSSIHEDFYQIIFVLSAFFYHPFFFGSKILDFDEVQVFEGDHLFRTAVSYILTPMLWIYLVIIYSYFLKTLFMGSWPVGGVSYWISALSVSGVLLYLLGYKYFRHPKFLLEKLFFNYYFIILLPAILLLFIAIVKRINAYGWTENRFFIVISGVWLLGIALYYIFSKQKKLVVIPASFALILFLSTVGPFSAYEVGFHNQQKELKELMTEKGLLSDTGFVYLPKNQLVDADIKRMSNIKRYLKNRKKLDAFVEANDPKKYASMMKNHHKSDHLFQRLLYHSNTTDINQVNEYNRWDRRNLNFNGNELIDISTYDNFKSLNRLRKNNYHLTTSPTGEQKLHFDEYPYEQATFIIPKGLIDSAFEEDKKYVNNNEDLCLYSVDEAKKYKLCLKRINIQKNKDTDEIRINTLQGFLFWKTSKDG